MTHSLRFLSLLSLLGLLATGQSRAQSGPYASTQARTAALVTTPAAAPVPPMVPAAPAISPDSVFINPEVRPQFVGGDKAFKAYLAKSIRYPQQALQRHVSGRVLVNFVLNAQGKVTDAHVISGPGSGLNDEALRLVWLMPPWEPARVNGQPVRVACTVPISFTTER
ncbi:energy transducer TonB [Hymenobacter properus]|uniref:Energy transducer TonB n=1 Tax=Hymenobacter properus TaxID=2791026 RepID=A0A931BQ90_9BACT|nr:energy transducer TonB [Hymenobacter properus]MBF9143620.1 energy transducer TonB [Hymenobacter properus]MBR7722433.1 energy transducer TonB [Microvirga sp. SRT04]